MTSLDRIHQAVLVEGLKLAKINSVLYVDRDKLPRTWHQNQSSEALLLKGWGLGCPSEMQNAILK